MDYMKMWFEAIKKITNEAKYGFDDEAKKTATKALFVLTEIECEEYAKNFTVRDKENDETEKGSLIKKVRHAIKEEVDDDEW